MLDGQIHAEEMQRGVGDHDHAGPFGSLWLCSRWHYEVLFVQVLLRAGKEGWIQSTWSERSVLLFKQLQCKEPGFKGHHLHELLLSPCLYTVVAPTVEADMREE